MATADMTPKQIQTAQTQAESNRLAKIEAEYARARFDRECDWMYAMIAQSCTSVK